MRRVLRFFLWGLIVVVALGCALVGYFVYSPAPEVPRLSGTLTRGTIAAGGLTRTYLTYVPRGLTKGAPLVVVMHGSGQNGAQMRRDMGYGFDRLADTHGFAVVYPNAYQGYWDVCSVVGSVNAKALNIDDVGFLTAMVDKLVSEIGIDPGRVFAVGSSRGGSMALRLALEAPARYRAVAAISANVPSPENFKCKPAGQGTSSVMLMNGTEDPLVPFDGGNVSLFGLFYRNGKVQSSRPFRLVLQERQGPVVATVRSIFCGPQPHLWPASDTRDLTTEWGARRASHLAQRRRRTDRRSG